MARGAGSLRGALARMRWRVRREPYALLSFPRRAGGAAAGALARLPRGALAELVLERAGATLLLPESRLAALRGRLGPARIRRGFRIISFEVPMEWTVVGFLARIAAALAEARVPIGVVCSFEFDHLFVPARRLPAARRAVARALRLP